MAPRKMHQTTVRFGPDLWEALEEECAELGVSVAQFVRDAALTRLMYMAGRRGDSVYERALERLGSVREPGRQPSPEPSAEPETEASKRERGETEMVDAWDRGEARRAPHES
jgi:hypothetical protein